MSRLRQIFYLILSVGLIATGIGLLFYVGLPDRADYTGYNLEDVGYVAPEIGSYAPPFTLITVDLDSFALDNLQGSIVIINFWATWCVPCRIEMPELQALYETYQGDIRILGVNLGESPQNVAQWKAEFNLTYDILLDPLQSVAQLYQIRGQPSTYILDQEHIIRAVYFGAVNMEQLERDVTLLLKR